LYDAYDQTADAHAGTQSLAEVQTTAKWGTQSGPQTFMTAYRTKLTEWAQQLTDIQAQIDGLAAGVQATVNAATETDQQQAQAFTKASTTQYNYDKTVDQIQAISGKKPSTGGGNTPGY